MERHEARRPGQAKNRMSARETRAMSDSRRDAPRQIVRLRAALPEIFPDARFIHVAGVSRSPAAVS
jgi:hypothetical protein